MIKNVEELVKFILRAKKATYAGGGRETVSSRPQSKDLPYSEGEYSYLDSYLGGLSFLGEEAVWHQGQPVWGMNYYGCLLAEVPSEFGHFLKEALLHVPQEAPYRGPAFYQEGRFTYRCAWSGNLKAYEGRESIELDGQQVYTLWFHGGEII